MLKRPALAVLAVTLMMGCTPASEAGETPATPPAAETPATGGFTPADLTALVEAQGATPAVQSLLETPEDPRWQAVLAGIGSGDAAWLDTIPAMAEGLDGEAAESVSYALSEGLAHNAAGVLRQAALLHSTESVCWHDPENPDAIAARMAAVEALPEDGELAADRDECLIWLSGEPT